MSLAPARVFPFSEGGSAGGTPLPAGRVTLTDLTAQPRFGIKGPGSSAWLASQGIALPPVNRIGDHLGVPLLRLGNEDFLFLSAPPAQTLEPLRTAWSAASGARGYSSWREEGWAWMRLGGMGAGDAMARLCAIDLRDARFGSDEIAQTRVGHLEAVLFRSPGGFDILFDITASAFFARTVAAVAQHLPGFSDSHEDHS